MVAMQISVATMENSMEFPQKTKNGTAFWPGTVVLLKLFLLLLNLHHWDGIPFLIHVFV